MADTQVSIGQVKRDISTLVNRVAFGGERVILTSRGKPKAALVSIEDYERLTEDNDDELARLEAWFVKRDALAERILAERGGKSLDHDTILEEAKRDLEERHDFLLRS